MEVLAEAGDADQAVEAITRVRRTRVVVLVGLGLSGEHDAYWLIRTLRQRYPTHAILGFGANADPTSISRGLFVGADGFVDKNIDPVEFLQSLRRAADREMVLAIPASSVRRTDRRGHRAPTRGGGQAHGSRARGARGRRGGLTARQIATRWACGSGPSRRTWRASTGSSASATASPRSGWRLNRASCRSALPSRRRQSRTNSDPSSSRYASSQPGSAWM